MHKEIIEKARALPRVKNFFKGKELPDGFNVPHSILLYCHDFEFPQTIISSRYMLIIPFTDLTYQIEENQFPLNYGQAILVKPYLHRSVPQLHQDYLRLIISFEVNGGQDYLPQEQVMTVSETAWNLINLILKHYENNDIVPLSFALTLLLQDLSDNQIKTEPQEMSPEIRHVIGVINQHLERLFSIKYLADIVELSASHLRRRFRDEMGVSLGKYIDSRRIASAQRLLLDTNLSIEKVANSCGYDSIYSFSRFFKKNMELSPLQFRKQFK